MTESASNPNRRRIFSLRKRETQIQEQKIRGRQTGNIRSDESVVIEEGAVVSGDVTAPQIRVAGLLHGTAVTYDFIVTSSGQIWGDVMAAQLQLEPGGQIQGWISTISPEEPLPDGEKQPTITAPLPELPEDSSIPSTRDASPNSLMRRLQNVAGKAQTDYTTLKKEFEQRLEARAGDALEKSRTYTKELSTIKRELRNVEKELAKTKTILADHETTINQQIAELAEAEVKTDEQRQKLDDYKKSYEASIKQQEALTEAKNSTEMTLLETLREVDALNEQIHTLEETLQTSIRRTVEQEDALLHWQELAGKNQERITKLEKEAETLNRQLEENALATGKLREKNGLLEFEFQQALDEMNTLRNQLPDATTEEMQFALADSRQQIATLKGLLEESKQAVEDAHEQTMWLEANLKTAQRSLEESRIIVSRQTALLEAIRAEKEGGEQTAGKWRTAVEEMAARLQEREKESQSIATQYTEQTKQLEAQIAQLEEEIRRKQLQVATFEDEVERHLTQMDEQGQRLAEIQAILIERELAIKQINQELKQARNKIAWQANFINKMKRISSETIADLETRLAQVQQGQAEDV